jgi:type IV secretion system protein VirB9
MMTLPSFLSANLAGHRQQARRMRFKSVHYLMTAALLGLVVAGAGSMPATASDGATDAQVDALAAGWRNGKGAAAEGVAGAVMMEYGETQPVLKCKVLNICTVRLRPGEVLTEAPTVGDSVRWSVAVRAGGNGRDKVVYVVVKPASTAEETSMFITTNERAYHIELHPSDTNYTPLLAFTYPEDREAENARRVAAMQAEAAQTERVAAQRAITVDGRAIPADELDFDYRISGKAAFKPARIFNDGARTYVDLPDSYRGELPVFVATGVSGNEIVNYRISGNRFIIDKVAPGGELTLGVGGRADTIRFRRAK